jgi:hypothetical protein
MEEAFDLTRGEASDNPEALGLGNNHCDTLFVGPVTSSDANAMLRDANSAVLSSPVHAKRTQRT